MGQFLYAAKAFDVLERLDPDPEYWEGKRGACVGVFQQVMASCCLLVNIDGYKNKGFRITPRFRAKISRRVQRRKRFGASTSGGGVGGCAIMPHALCSYGCQVILDLPAFGGSSRIDGRLLRPRL